MRGALLDWVLGVARACSLYRQLRIERHEAAYPRDVALKRLGFVAASSLFDILFRCPFACDHSAATRWKYAARLSAAWFAKVAAKAARTSRANRSGLKRIAFSRHAEARIASR